MKLLVTGAGGLVGSHFIENYASHKDIVFSPALEELDITNQKSVENFFKLNKPDAVIHFAAFTDVFLAEQQRDNKKASCWIINVDGTSNLVKAMNPDSYFIYISTDVVFSGNKDNPGPYAENDPPETNSDLLSWYGWTKREAEKLVIQKLKKSVILRISNPVRANYLAKMDYVRKILSLFDTGKLYPMFSDQFLTLSYINEITLTLEVLLEKRPDGIFHASSTNVFTPYKLTNLLIEKARGVKDAVSSIGIETFLKNNPARYPQYGGLKIEQTQKMLGLNFTSWEKIIEDLAKQLSIQTIRS